jgi:transposase-like protein
MRSTGTSGLDTDFPTVLFTWCCPPSPIAAPATRPCSRSHCRSRNGTTSKTMLTDIGAVDLAVPRDRNGSFEPQIVRKGQTRLEGFNERIIALYARG